MDGLLHVSDLVWGRVPHPSTDRAAGRGNSSAGSEVRQGKAAHFAGPQAIASRSVGDGAGALSGGHARAWKSGGRDGLRRFRSDRAGRRRLGARQRNELVEAHEAPFEDREGRRRCGCGGAGSEDRPAPHFAGLEADAARSVGGRRGKISSGHDRERAAFATSRISARSSKSKREWKG